MVSSAHGLQERRWRRINRGYFGANLRQLRYGDDAAINDLERRETAFLGAAASDIQVYMLAFLEVHTAHVGPMAGIGRAVTGSEIIVELIGNLVCIKMYG